MSRIAAIVAVCASTVATFAAAAVPCQTPGFVAPLSLDRGTAQRVALALADIDLDGRPDIVSLHRYGDVATSGRVATVLLNRGANAFDPEPVLANANSDFTTIAVADVNHDGVPDLIFGGTSPLTIEFGNGNGSFRDGLTVDLRNVVAIAAGDFNEDGWTDLVVAQVNPATVSILVSDHTGGFTVTDVTSLQGEAVGMALGDFDGDHHLDVVVAHAQGVTAFFGDGKGGFSQSSPVWPLSSTAIAAGDLDHDGRPELLVGIGNGFNVFHASGRSFASVSTLTTTRRVSSLAIADIDRDGTLDAITVGDGDLHVFRGSGGGLFLPPMSYVAGPGAERVAVADLDADGWPDVVTVNRDGMDLSLMRNEGGVLQAMREIDGPSGAPTLTVADLNLDGIPDLIAAGTGSTGLAIYRGRSDGTLDAATSLSTGVGIRAVRVGDVNGDGIPDIVALSADGSSLLLFLASNVDQFKSRTTIPLTNAACCIELTSVDADKRADLIFGQQQGGVGVALSTGAGFAPAKIYATAPVSTMTVAALDTTAAPAVVAGTANGTFVLTSVPKQGFAYGGMLPPLSPRSVGVINVSGAPAIVSAGDGVDVFTSDRALNFNRGYHQELPPGKPSAMVTGDLNGDGNADSITASYDRLSSAHFVTPLINEGNGNFAAVVPIETDTAPAALALTDLDRNGTIDLIVASDGKIMFARGRCEAPRVTLVTGLAQAADERAVLVAAATGGWPAGATYTFREEAQVLGTVAGDPSDPGVARFAPSLSPGSHQISVTVNFADGSSATSPVMTITEGGGRHRPAKH